MWMWRNAQITPRSTGTLPPVPSSVQPGLSAMSPLSRIGGCTPSLNCSVIAISTCEYFRAGQRLDVLLREVRVMRRDFDGKRVLLLRFEHLRDVGAADRAQRFARHHALLV